ncbi:MAG TPA: hypothetical protein VK633_08515 [Verrucomicrobiae bacterium]|nr:hypothetical protein [Verrucomicrobiae bacterium]
MYLVSRLAALLPALLLLFSAGDSQADTNKADSKGPEQKFQAILIWGTDGDKPPEKEKELTSVEGGLKDKFKNIFKWKNYFQVGERKTVLIHSGETKQLQLSHKCQLKLHQTDKEGLEVELIGEGIPVVKRKHTMPLKDILILAGDDKNSTAWFVVLKPE